MNLKSQLMKMKDVFLLFGVDYQDMDENSELDVSDYGVKIKSFNHKLQKEEYKLIERLVRKSDCEMYSIYNDKNEELFKCTNEHKLYTKDGYKMVKDLPDKFCAFSCNNSTNSWLNLTSKLLKNKFPVLDITVQDNENYYTNNILSHNSTDVTSGGNALKFYASIRIEVRRSLGDSTRSDEEGMTTVAMNVKIIKNKVAPPYKKVQVELDTGKNGRFGFDTFKEILDIATKEKIIVKAGSWYSYNEEKIGQGKDRAAEWLKENIDVYEAVKNRVFEIVKNQNKPVIGSMNDEIQKQEQEKEEKKERKRKAKEEVEVQEDIDTEGTKE